MIVTVTLSDRQFVISSQACVLLEAKLTEVTRSMPQGMRGVVSDDVEQRLADYFTSRLSGVGAIGDEDVEVAFKDLGLGSSRKDCQGDETRGESDRTDESANDSSSEKQAERKDVKRETGKSLRRSRTQVVVAGVCGGIAERFGWDVVWVRVAFVCATLMLWQVWVPVAYVILWALLPSDDFVDSADGADIRLNGSSGGSSCGGCLKVVALTLLVLAAFAALFIGGLTAPDWILEFFYNLFH